MISSQAPTWTSLIIACATAFTALGGLVSVLSVFLPILRSTRKNEAKIEEVHIIVNQQRTDAQRYQRALVKALEAAGIDVPDDQSIDPLE
jgi:hypothetical protein